MKEKKKDSFWKVQVVICHHVMPNHLKKFSSSFTSSTFNVLQPPAKEVLQMSQRWGYQCHLLSIPCSFIPLPVHHSLTAEPFFPPCSCLSLSTPPARLDAYENKHTARVLTGIAAAKNRRKKRKKETFFWRTVMHTSKSSVDRCTWKPFEGGCDVDRDHTDTSDVQVKRLLHQPLNWGDGMRVTVLPGL